MYNGERTNGKEPQFLQCYMLITYVLGYICDKLLATIEMCLETNDCLHWAFAKLEP